MVTVAEDVAHGRALAKDAQGPGFHFQHCQKKKNTGNGVFQRGRERRMGNHCLMAIKFQFYLAEGLAQW
jgi:hypothetical protein